MGPGWPRGGGWKDIWKDVRKDVRKDIRKDGRLEIHPCVLQDIGPLGPLQKVLQKHKMEEKDDVCEY